MRNVIESGAKWTGFSHDRPGTYNPAGETFASSTVQEILRVLLPFLRPSVRIVEVDTHTCVYVQNIA